MATRILVTAACTADTIAAGLKLLLPNAEISSNHVAGILMGDNLEQAEDLIKDVDHWIYLKKPQTSALAERFGNGIAIPEIAFNAFHPDEVTAFTPTEVVMGPTASLHSAIGVWAYVRGCTPREAARLFKPNVFEELGYLDCWESSAAELEKGCDDTGIDYGQLISRIKRQMPFMTTVRHPRAAFTAEISRQLAPQLGYKGNPAHDPIEDFITDGMRVLPWPVYPGVAERYGLRGALRWRHGNDLYHSVESYLEACFKVYADRDSISCERLGDAYTAILERHL